MKEPYDTALRVRDLDQFHPEYLYLHDIWVTIRELKEGATSMLRNVKKYCPKRPGEDEEIYKLRLQKFSYTPVMSSAIRKFIAKLSSSPINLTTDNPDFWELFRSNTNGARGAKSRKEKALVNELFSSILYYGRVYVSVDAPKSNARSVYEASKQQLTPYLKVWEPHQVINWGDDWYTVKYERLVTNPTKAHKYITRWEVYTDTSVSIYEIDTEASDPSKPVVYIDTWEHGLGSCPMVSMELPNELWTGANVVLKQIQHTLIENGWTDAGSIAGMIQRIFTPNDPPPADDTRYAYEQPEYQELGVHGNAYVLVGKNYDFKESSGSAIGNLTSQLQVIEQQIKDLVDMSFASTQPGAIEQSGKSKEVDMTLLNDTMETYGNYVLGIYQDCLGLVAMMANLDTPSINGLNTYSSNNLSQMLEQTDLLEGKPLPAIVLKTWFGKLSSLLLGGVTKDLESEVQKEIEQMYQEGVFKVYENGSQGIENTPENITKLVQVFGIDPEQAKEVLSA